MSESQEFYESFFPGSALSEARINRDAGVIHDVALLGKVSQNGRRYTDAAMREAVEHYRGARVFVDHPRAKELEARGGIRSVLDLAGKVVNPRKTGDRVRGDLALLDREPTKSLFLSLAEHPDLVGMSHRARGRVEVEEDGTQVVHSIDAVHGVELVVEPASTENLFESSEALIESLEKEAQRKQEVRDLFLELGLPEEKLQELSERTIASLAEIEDDDKREAHVRDWVECYEQAHAPDEQHDLAESRWRRRRRRGGRGGGGVASKSAERDPDLELPRPSENGHGPDDRDVLDAHRNLFS